MKMKRCPKCTSLMPGDVSRCIRCGFDSKPAAAPAARAPAAPAARAPAAAPAGAAAAMAVPANVMPVKAGRIANGIALMRSSWEVLKLDKEMMVFPLVSGIACFLVLASFLGGAFAADLVRTDRPPSETLFWVLLFAYYFVNYFVIVFFNSALVACVMKRFEGGDPTVGYGLRAAAERLPQIVSWALLAAGVGVVLKMIERRVGVIGRIVVALLGAAWAIATYFVVPVLVVEKLGPLAAAKRSVEIIKDAWGESIVSNVGVGIITFLAFLFIVVPVGVASLLLAAQAQSVAVAIAGAAVTIGLGVLVVLASSTMNAIIMTAIYLYAAEKKVPQAFDAGRLAGAFSEA